MDDKNLDPKTCSIKYTPEELELKDNVLRYEMIMDAFLFLFDHSVKPVPQSDLAGSVTTEFEKEENYEFRNHSDYYPFYSIYSPYNYVTSPSAILQS